MPYRVTIDPVNERRAELDAIVTANGKIVTFKTNDPKRLRYRLNEALYAARVLSIEPYASLRVTLHVRPPLIHVAPKHEVFIESTLIEVEQAFTVDVPEIAIFEKAVTEFDVVKDAMARPDLLELRFPQFSGNIAPIERWCKARNYTYTTDPVLTLRREPDANS